MAEGTQEEEGEEEEEEEGRCWCRSRGVLHLPFVFSCCEGGVGGWVWTVAAPKRRKGTLIAEEFRAAEARQKRRRRGG